jgi:hypothetical protein
MKKVFSSNDALCHVFASQSQDSGKTGNMFFNGNVLYSYGLHYPLMALHNGVALINSEKSSKTTEGKHKNAARRAVRHMVIFSVPNIEEPAAQENVDYLLNTIAQSFVDFISSRSGGTFWLDDLKDQIKKFSQFVDAFKLDPKLKKLIELDDVTLDVLEALATLQNQKSAENEAKRQEKNKAQNAAWEFERQKRAEANESKLQAWIKGESNELPYDVRTALRINGDTVETSLRASVPLSEAQALVLKIKNGENVVGQKIGFFTVNKIDEKQIVVGCHNIPLAEVTRLFA